MVVQPPEHHWHDWRVSHVSFVYFFSVLVSFVWKFFIFVKWGLFDSHNLSKYVKKMRTFRWVCTLGSEFTFTGFLLFFFYDLQYGSMLILDFGLYLHVKGYLKLDSFLFLWCEFEFLGLGMVVIWGFEMKLRIFVWCAGVICCWVWID